MLAVPISSALDDRYTVLDIDYQKDRLISVFSENFVDLDIMDPERVSGGVPSNELLLLTDLRHKLITFLIMSNICS